MQRNKERLTVTVDPDVVRAANVAVRAGRAKSLSEWVNVALVERAAEENRQRAARRAIKAFEAEHGAITALERERQAQADRRAATKVRPSRRAARKVA